MLQYNLNTDMENWNLKLAENLFTWALTLTVTLVDGL